MSSLDAPLAPAAPSAPAASTVTAFAGFRRIAAGTRAEVVAALRAAPDADGVIVFDDETGERVEWDAGDGRAADVAAPAPPARTVGRPRLGVVAREVTLLPRHWEWLGRQPGGASVALRRLVEEARRVNAGRDAQRAAQEAAYRFMTAIGGDLAGFEEATRALFAGERARFETLVAPWPPDVSAHLHRLAAAAWGPAR